MVFSSETFLFLFLPLMLAFYYVTPMAYRSHTLLAGSWLFYGWWRIDFLGLLILVTAFTYYCGLQIKKYEDTGRAKFFLVLGVSVCLAALGVFKYLNFFIDSIASFAGTTPDEMGIHWRLILPIGISFYIFQSLSYVVDIYRKEAPPTRNFVDFAAFIALFPQLIAGPILRFKDLADQMVQREHSVAMFATGTAIFTIGLAKKILLADTIAPVADAMFALANPTLFEAWLGAISYSLQLYFDFSGYSDMAVGLGMMIGFRFIHNFNRPYTSRSITEFWRRWHISLSVWLRDYLYIPLGGNRVGSSRVYLNLMIVMVLGGLWHGANWTFVMWGFWHGLWLCAERYTRWDKRSASSVIAWPMTMVAVMIGWVFFRSANVGDAFNVLSGMAGLNGTAIHFDFASAITTERLLFLSLAALAIAYENFASSKKKGEEIGGYALISAGGASAVEANLWQVLGGQLVLISLFVLTVAKLAEQSFSPFLYFQF